MIQPTHIKLESNSPEETIAGGRSLSRILDKGDTIVLEGALGTGKTTFVKGVLEGLGYKGDILSPTFTLVREYNTKKALIYHIDLYRIEACDLVTIGIDDLLFNPDTIALIEWGDKIESELARYIKVKFSVIGECNRLLNFYDDGLSQKKMETLAGFLK